MDFIITYPSEQADQIRKFFEETGGIKVWQSINLSDPNKTVTTSMSSDKPSWEVSNTPADVITDSSLVGIVKYQEAKRIRVYVRRSSNGMMLKLTDNSTHRLRKALDKAGADAIYRFDYETQEAVIFTPEKIVSLAEWMAK